MKAFFRNGETKTYSNEQKLRESVPRRPALKNMFKELSREKKKRPETEVYISKGKNSGRGVNEGK